MPVGAGSYASYVPPANQFAGGYFSPAAQQVVDLRAPLHLAPGITNRPLPSNQWWTDLLVGDRSFQPQGGGRRVMRQDPYGGMLWAYPAVVAPNATGFNLHFPVAWQAAADTNHPNGNMDPGPPLRITGTKPTQLPSGDRLIAGFSGSEYPPGWTSTGTAFGRGPVAGGSWPAQSPAVEGLVGPACVNSYRGSDVPQGTLASPVFNLDKKFIHLLVGGGRDTNLEAVRLIIGTNVVRTATGRQSGTLYWNTWDVSAYLGQQARIEIIDRSSGGWGFILCDFIVATDEDAAPAARYTGGFHPTHSEVTDWSDWGVQFGLVAADGARMDLTLARGSPFIWTACRGTKPVIHTEGAALFDAAGRRIAAEGGSFTNDVFACDFHGRCFGIFAPPGTVGSVVGDAVEVAPGPGDYLVYGLLPARDRLAEFAAHAFARVTGTTLEWDYQPAAGRVETTWKLAVSPLRPGQTNALQGWLPHHYRATSNDLAFRPYTYLTPRGGMKVTAGNTFHIAYEFHGLAPALPAPQPLGLPHDYDAARMAGYVSVFAREGHPHAVGETYGQGKELGLTAQYLGFARALGMTKEADRLHAGLHDLLADWLTYTPGETNRFFALYTNWPALIGFPASYGSEAFNDNHFHYGYFLVAGALLGGEDPRFVSGYGPMLKLVAREFANWDRSDRRFPLFRTFDLWEGHSWAGGFSSGAGENQESSSEAMNAWSGLFLSGSALGDPAMSAAGALGYAMESAAVNEYWQDVSGANLPPGYGRGMVGILQAGGSAYATYFTGDPAWMYAIQWVPTTHWNHYLARDPAFARNQLERLWRERVQSSRSGLYGFALKDANRADDLGGYLGNYILGYQALFDSDVVAATLDIARATNNPVTVDPVFSGVSYFLTHALRGLGSPDPAVYAGLPSSQVYYQARDRRRTLVAFNPGALRSVTVYHRGGLAWKTVSLPAGSSVVDLGEDPAGR